MAAYYLTYKSGLAYRALEEALAQKWNELIGRLNIRPCMLNAFSLFLAGMGSLLLMQLGLFPATLLTGFCALVLVAAGSLALLVLYGEL